MLKIGILCRKRIGLGRAKHYILHRTGPGKDYFPSVRTGHNWVKIAPRVHNSLLVVFENVKKASFKLSVVYSRAVYCGKRGWVV